MLRRNLLTITFIVTLFVVQQAQVHAGGHFYGTSVIYSAPLVPVVTAYAPAYYYQPAYVAPVSYSPAVVQPVFSEVSYNTTASYSTPTYTPTPVVYSTPVNSAPIVHTVSYTPAVVPYRVPVAHTVAYVSPVSYVAARNYTYRARTGWFGATRVVERIR